MILQAKRQTAKRKRSVATFQAWVCKIAGLWIAGKTEDGVQCDTTMCDACMTIWRETGYRSNQQLSDQEKAIMEEAEAKKKKEERAKRGRLAKKASVSHVTAKIRASRRVLEQDFTTKTSDSKHQKDKNGCSHDCKDCYQPYSDVTYWRTKWREDQGSGARLLSPVCIDCGERIWV
jgi:hypothetical protein